MNATHFRQNNVNDVPWPSMALSSVPCSMVLHCMQWCFLALNGPLWCSTALHGPPWCFMALKGFPMMLHSPLWCSCALNSVSWPLVMFHGPLWCYMALNGVPWPSMTLSMTQLLSHTFAHLTGSSFRLKAKLLPIKNILGVKYN